MELRVQGLSGSKTQAGTPLLLVTDRVGHRLLAAELMRSGYLGIVVVLSVFVTSQSLGFRFRVVLFARMVMNRYTISRCRSMGSSPVALEEVSLVHVERAEGCCVWLLHCNPTHP